MGNPEPSHDPHKWGELLMRWWSLSHKDRFRFLQKVAKYHAQAELHVGGTSDDAENAEARYIELLRNTAIRLVRLRNVPRGKEREDATMWKK